jgi:hypothetical protein
MIDLAPFIEPHNIRAYLHAPCLVDGHGIVASDGSILVVVDAATPVTPSPAGEMPDRVREALESLHQKKAAALLHTATEALHISGNATEILCQTCKGHGKRRPQIYSECDDCEGTGSFKHGQHTYTCTECNGEGEVQHADLTRPAMRCDDCCGTGLKPQGVSIPGNTVQIQQAYLTHIQRLPNATIYTPTEKYGPVYFTFTGGWGAVMPYLN